MTVLPLSTAFRTSVWLAPSAWSIDVKEALQCLNVSVGQTSGALTVNDNVPKVRRKEGCFLTEVVEMATQ
jgi:hypothetical protein